MRRLALFLLTAFVLVGCSGNGDQPKFAELHPVRGTVVADDGSPVQGGAIQFVAEPEDPSFLINSEVAADGTFELSTVRTTDTRGERKKGAPAGKYRAIFMPVIADQTQSNQGPITVEQPVDVPLTQEPLKISLPKQG